MKTRPVFFAKTIFCGARPPMRSSALMKHDSAICWHICRLNVQRCDPVGSVLYMNCEKMFSVTCVRVISA